MGGAAAQRDGPRIGFPVRWEMMEAAALAKIRPDAKRTDGPPGTGRLKAANQEIFIKAFSSRLAGNGCLVIAKNDAPDLPKGRSASSYLRGSISA